MYLNRFTNSTKRHCIMKFVVKQTKAVFGKAKGQMVYQAIQQPGRTISSEEVIRDIAEMSSLTTGDVRNALDRIAYYLKRELSAGNAVQLGTIGTLRPSAGAKYVDDLKAANATSVRRPRIQLIPGLSLRQAISQTKIQVDNPYVVTQPEGTATTAPSPGSSSSPSSPSGGGTGSPGSGSPGSAGSSSGSFDGH